MQAAGYLAPQRTAAERSERARWRAHSGEGLRSRGRPLPSHGSTLLRYAEIFGEKIVQLLLAMLAIIAIAAPCFAGPALPPIAVSLIMVTWVGPTPVPPDVQTPAIMLVGSFTGPPGDANAVGSAMHQCKQAAETALINVGGPPNAVGVSFQCVQSK